MTDILKTYVEKIDEGNTINSIKHSLALVLAQTIIYGDFSDEHLKLLKSILPALKLPDVAIVMLNNIIENKIKCK
jgi:uncharacterized protein Yka (UPF0111/DUF47 family)